MGNSEKKTEGKVITRLFRKDGRTGKVSEIFNSGEVDMSYKEKLKPRKLTACPHCGETHHCVGKKPAVGNNPTSINLG